MTVVYMQLHACLRARLCVRQAAPGANRQIATMCARCYHDGPYKLQEQLQEQPGKRSEKLSNVWRASCNGPNSGKRSRASCMVIL